MSEALRYAIQYYKVRNLITSYLNLEATAGLNSGFGMIVMMMMIYFNQEATAGLNSGFGMGYGASGPPSGGNKRPYDFNNYGGGYSRPPKQYRKY